MLQTRTQAPPLHVTEWFNTDKPITLEALRGRVVVLHAFQMLCPGCVAQGLPQAMKVHALFPASDVVVLGLHTVFEHHDVMGPNALKVFLHEYRIAFPVGVDLPVMGHPVPATMHAYGFRGTPSLVVIDRNGRVRLNHFGHMDDLQLGALLGTLLSEAAPSDIGPAAAPEDREFAEDRGGHCADGQCMTTYHPINCAFHDVIESYATRRESVDLVVEDAAEVKRSIRTVVCDVFSRNGEEFLVTEGGEKIRLDRVKSIGTNHAASFD